MGGLFLQTSTHIFSKYCSREKTAFVALENRRTSSQWIEQGNQTTHTTVDLNVEKTLKNLAALPDKAGYEAFWAAVVDFAD